MNKALLEKFNSKASNSKTKKFLWNFNFCVFYLKFEFVLEDIFLYKRKFKFWNLIKNLNFKIKHCKGSFSSSSF
jgi:hypothetical protein